MAIRLIHGDVFAAHAEALIVTLDGAATGLRGNIAHGFIRRWPEAYADLKAEVRFPMRLGTAQLVRFENDSPFPAVLFVSTLNHADTFSEEQKLGVLRAALAHALDLAHRARIHGVATTVLKGGWRLDVKVGFDAMKDAYPGTAFAPSGGQCDVYVLDGNEYAAISGGS